MTIRHPHFTAPAILAVAGLSLVAVAACPSGSAATVAGPGAAGASTAAANAPAAAPPSGKSFNDCTLVTAQEMSQAVSVKYTAIARSDVGTICNVTGANDTDTFFYDVEKEGAPLNTWSEAVAIIKRDDGSVTSVSGMGDRAAQGAIKEFSAESDGYIVTVVGADAGSAAPGPSFTRTKKVEKLLLSKL